MLDEAGDVGFGEQFSSTGSTIKACTVAVAWSMAQVIL